MTVIIITNMVLVKSGFHTRYKFFRKLSAIRAHALKNVRQPCLGRKSLKNIDFKGAKLFACPEHQIINLPGEPICLRTALTAVYI